MAEVFAIVASAAAVAEMSGKLANALFKVAQTIKQAPTEMEDMAQEVLLVSVIFSELADVIRSYEKLCTQELFRKTHDVLERFKAIQIQLTDLTKRSGRKLSRLRWLFVRSEAKAMMHKVESTKTAVTLIIMTIRLTAEQLNIQAQQATQAAAPTPGTQRASPPRIANRFRKVLESVVQANRLTIDRAQKEDEYQPNEKRRHWNGRLCRWEADSHDTATWLYHLVFSDGGNLRTGPEATKRRRIEPHNATVEDYDSDNPNASHVVVESGSAPDADDPPYDKSIIVWNSATEASRVADRLLQAWTILDAAQIRASKAFYESDKEEAWRAQLVERVREFAKKKAQKGKGPTERAEDARGTYFSDDESSGVYVSSDSSDDEYQSAEESTFSLDAPSPPQPTTSSRTRPPWVRDVPSPADHSGSDFMNHGLPPYMDAIPHLHGPSTSSNGYLTQPVGGNLRDNPFYPTYNHLPMTDHPFGFTSPPYPPFPMGRDYSAGQTNPILGEKSPHPPTTPAPPPPPPPPPPGPDDSASLLSRLETILVKAAEQKEENESKLDILERLLAESIAYHREESRVKEDQMQPVDVDSRNEKLARLERLLIEHRNEQQKRHEESEAAWRAEKAKSDARAAQEALQARELAEKEIAVAKAAKKAAEKALKFAKEQAAERARREAEAKAVEERRKIDEDYRRRIERYEEQLAALSRQWQKYEEIREGAATPSPLRRTCISEAGRRIEISEFTKDKLEPFITSSVQPSGFIQEDFYEDDPIGFRNSQGPWLNDRHGKAANMSTASPWRPSQRNSYSRETRTSEPSPSQKMILLPSHLDRTSTETAEMRDSLYHCGVIATFESDQHGNNGSLVQSRALNTTLIRGSIFWTPPFLPLGSELLSTLKLSGWKPFYARISDLGQTYFLGHEPVHVHFFRPEYRPQFNASGSNCASEYIVIAQDMIEETALGELGFEYVHIEPGGYGLDGRLTAADIEALIERSFMIRETNFRKLHRRLLWEPLGDTRRSRTTAKEDDEPSVISEGTTSSSRYGDYDDQLSTSEVESTPVNSPAYSWQDLDSAYTSIDSRNLKDEVNSSKDNPMSAISTGSWRGGPLRLRPTKVKTHID